MKKYKLLIMSILLFLVPFLKVDASSRFCLDYPSIGGIYGDKLYIQGWVMSDEELTIEVLIDGHLIANELVRYERMDVINKISGYGGIISNPTPGFRSFLDVSTYLDGTHQIKLRFSDKNNKLVGEISRDFIIKENLAIMRIDVPTQESIFDNELFIKGWLMTTNSAGDFHIYIDNDEVNVDFIRLERPDVVEKILLYGDKTVNSTPGFIGTVNIDKYDNGFHTLKIVYQTKDGIILTAESKQFEIKKDIADLRIDAPINVVEGTNLFIKGWVMSPNTDLNINAYIDDNLLNINFERYERPDVLKVIFGYGDSYINSKPGFISNYDLSTYANGTHKFKIELVNSNNQIINFMEREFELKKYKSEIRIDSIVDNAKIDGTTLELRGWLLSNDRNSLLEVYIDNELINLDINRTERKDALNKYGSNYDSSLNTLPGFQSVIDMSNYKDGVHIIKVVEKDTKTGEEVISLSRNFKLKKFDGIIHLDYPQKSYFSNSSNLLIQGWELSDTSDSLIKIYIDNKEVVVERYERQDVLAAYPNSYNGASANGTPGFRSNINLMNYFVGTHTIKIELYTSFGDLIYTVNKNFYLRDKMYFGIDVSSHQGKINWGSVARYGIDFAILRLGYGDNFINQDDVQFINNVNGVSNYGIPYGVYLYSYANKLVGTTGLNVDSASVDSEVEHTLRLLNSLTSTQKQQLKLPIFIDMEDDSTLFVGRNVLTQIADRYCTAIEKAGYECGIYANKNWLKNNLDSVILESKYDIWLAHYTNDFNMTSDYNGIYQLWQYSSNGNIPGILSSGLDLNVSYKKYW